MEIIEWAIDELNKKGYQVRSSSQGIIQNTPWSTVYRIETNQGFIFLKIVPPALSLEPKIIKILQERFQAPVPHLVASNEAAHCFLMKDAGIQLHAYFKEEDFDADLLIKLLKKYGTFQMQSAEAVNLFIEMGVPDWRLEKLPRLYHELIAQKDLLLNDGLNEHEYKLLKKLEPQLVYICANLSSYNINETFGHGDFHDKNILIDTNGRKITWIDLGEVVITHPFFSLLNCLYRAKENFSLSSEQYEQMKIESLEPWLALETQNNLISALALIQQCWSIHAVLGELRLIRSVNQQDGHDLSRQGRLAEKLRAWIGAAKEVA